MAVVFEKPKSLADVPLHYCPGCTHGIIHRLVAEAIEELGVDDTFAENFLGFEGESHSCFSLLVNED